MPQSKQAMFSSISALCDAVRPTTKKAEDGPSSTAPGANEGASNDAGAVNTGELASEVEADLKKRTASTTGAPDATLGKNKEQQLMIGHESHQVDGIDLPIGSEAKDPGTESPARVGGEKYAGMTFAATHAEAVKLGNEIMKEALAATGNTVPQSAANKTAAAVAAGQQAAAGLVERKKAIVKSAIHNANIDADLLIGFLKKRAEEENQEHGDEEPSNPDESSESSAPPEGAGDPNAGMAPAGGEGGGDPLAGLIEPGPGAPPSPAGDAGMPPGGGMGGEMPGMPGGMPAGMPGGDPGAGAGAGGNAELIQQLLALLAQQPLEQMQAAGGAPAKVANVVLEHLKSASPAQKQMRAQLRKELHGYVGEVA